MKVDTAKFAKVSIIIPTRNRKDDILACLASLKENTYPNYEIIVIDDASDDGTTAEIPKKFPDVLLIRNEISEGAPFSRNRGAEISSGEYLFFLDSDTVVDRICIDELTKVFRDYPSAGLAAPIIYYFEDNKRIWFAGARISLLTSKAHYRGIGKLDDGRFSNVEVLENGHAPTASMIKRVLFNEVGGFDHTFFIGFEEPDIAKRIEKAGYKIMFAPTSKVWHKVPVLEYKYKNRLSEFLFYISFRNPNIAYHTSKNRVRYMKRYTNSLIFIVFLILFLPISVVIYLQKSILSWQPEMALNIMKGSIDGLKTALLSNEKRKMV